MNQKDLKLGIYSSRVKCRKAPVWNTFMTFGYFKRNILTFEEKKFSKKSISDQALVFFPVNIPPW